MLNIILGIVGVIGYLYLSWRTLKENYQEEDVVAFSWVAILLFLMGGRIGFGLIHWGIWSNNPGAWFEFWKMGEISLIGASGIWMAFAVLIAKDKEWKLWSFLEDSLVSTFFLLMVSGAVLKDWKIMIALGIAGILSVLVGKKYHSLTWYKSGKKGFLFFWFSIIFWLVLGSIYRIYWLSAFSLLFMVGLFMLGNDKFSK
jgi:hypothetical protein